MGELLTILRSHVCVKEGESNTLNNLMYLMENIYERLTELTFYMASVSVSFTK